MKQRLTSTRRRFLSGFAAGAAGAAAWPWPGARVAAQGSREPQAPAGPPRFPGFAAGADGEAFWSDVRRHFSLDPRLTFLNNGTLGPAPDIVVDTREYYSRLLATDPTDCFRSKELAEVRAQLAAFIDAKPEETSITHSTTEGMNIFAHGLDWKAGDEVVLCDQEHFGAVEPYRTLAARQGVRIVTVKLPVPAVSVGQIVETYAKAFTPRTRALVVSHVSWLTGLVAPLRELSDLAHAHGALISVDGAQSFGVLPLDVQATGIDHFAGSGQKWLLAGTGTGVNYVRRAAQEKIWPLFGFDNPSQHTSTRYERSGQLGIPAATGIGAALQFQTAIGKSRIEAHARELGRQVREGVARIPGASLLSSTDPALSANLQVFTLRAMPSPDVVRLLEQKERIIVRGITLGDTKAIRVSTHVYNTPQQVERLVGLLAAWSKNPPAAPSMPAPTAPDRQGGSPCI
jgi:selenocysteine lyase/cysteine desulfurase